MWHLLHQFCNFLLVLYCKSELIFTSCSQIKMNTQTPRSNLSFNVASHDFALLVTMAIPITASQYHNRPISLSFNFSHLPTSNISAQPQIAKGCTKLHAHRGILNTAPFLRLIVRINYLTMMKTVLNNFHLHYVLVINATFANPDPTKFVVYRIPSR